MLNYNGCKKIKGKFYNFRITKTIKRTKRNDHLIPFIDGTRDEFSYEIDVFCESISHVEHLINHYNSISDNDIKYHTPILVETIKGGMTGVQVFEYLRLLKGWNNLAYYNTIGDTQYIK